MNPQMANEWPLIGLILALVLIFAAGVAAWTRLVAKAKLRGQTIWHVVVGVAGVVALGGLRLGADVVIFYTVCFAVASIPMAVEYFTRINEEEREAQKILEEQTEHVDASASRED